MLLGVSVVHGVIIPSKSYIMTSPPDTIKSLDKLKDVPKNLTAIGNVFWSRTKYHRLKGTCGGAIELNCVGEDEKEYFIKRNLSPDQDNKFWLMRLNNRQPLGWAQTAGKYLDRFAFYTVTLSYLCPLFYSNGGDVYNEQQCEWEFLYELRTENGEDLLNPGQKGQLVQCVPIKCEMDVPVKGKPSDMPPSQSDSPQEIVVPVEDTPPKQPKYSPDENCPNSYIYIGECHCWLPESAKRKKTVVDAFEKRANLIWNARRRRLPVMERLLEKIRRLQ